MTVQKLINELNKIQDKSKYVILHPNGITTEYDMMELDSVVILY